MTSVSQGTSQSTSQSGFQVPNLPQTSILDSIATAAENYAPQMMQWAQQAYAKGQSFADALNAQANSYSSPEKIAADMGGAEAATGQSMDAARQNALQTLEGYGIDPSAGRFAGLDRAEQMQKGAAEAGAGNQQRLATEATGRALRSEAANVQLANNNIGASDFNVPNNYLSTAIRLPYSPLGQVSNSQSSSQNSSVSTSPTGAGGGGSSSDPFNPANPSFPSNPFNNAPTAVGGSYSAAPPSSNSGYGGGYPNPFAGTDVPGVDSSGFNNSIGVNGFSGGSEGFVGPVPDSESTGFAPEGGIDMSGMGVFDTGGGFAKGGPVGGATTGGFVSRALSPSGGQNVDDIPARVNAEEFVIPRDVVRWKGQEFFQKLIAAARKTGMGAPAKPTTKGGVQHAATGGSFSFNPTASNFNPNSVASFDSAFGAGGVSEFGVNPGLMTPLGYHPSVPAASLQPGWTYGGGGWGSGGGYTVPPNGGWAGGSPSPQPSYPAGGSPTPLPPVGFNPAAPHLHGDDDDDGPHLHHHDDDDGPHLHHHDDDDGIGTPPAPGPGSGSGSGPPVPSAGPSNVVNGIDLTTGGTNTGRLPSTPAPTVMPNSFQGVGLNTTPYTSSFYTRGFVPGGQ